MPSSLDMATAGAWRGKQTHPGLNKREQFIFHSVSSTWFKLPSRASLKWHTICRSYLLFEITFLYGCNRLFSLQHGACSLSRVKPSGRVKCCPSSRTLAMSWCGGLAVPWHTANVGKVYITHQSLLLRLEGSQLPSLPWEDKLEFGSVSFSTCV